MSFFSLDSKFSQIMGRVFDLMMLNIIFLIMCIPIVTIGANFTAMYYVTLKMIKNEETYIFRTYWKSFRENFKQATAIWLILLAVLIVLIAGHENAGYHHLPAFCFPGTDLFRGHGTFLCISGTEPL